MTELEKLDDGNGWIQTYTGKRFSISNIDLDSICIEDIAHALSLQCRFNGHCEQFYSVAEHSVLIAKELYYNSRDNGISLDISKTIGLTALLHDASEAYIADIPSPFKKLMPEYKIIEKSVEEAIATKFNLFFPYPDIIKEYDTRILVDEKAAIMKNCFEWEIDNLEPLNVFIECLSPKEAEQAFLITYDNIMKDIK